MMLPNSHKLLLIPSPRTVDLISYRVLALDPILEVEETKQGSGHLCGSVFLDRIFAKYLTDKFGAKISKKILSSAIAEYDKIKRNFDGESEGPYEIALPIKGDPNGIKDGTYELTSATVKSLFDPVVNEIIRLVREEVQATPGQVKKLVLMGGFGSNPYLGKQLEAAIDLEVTLPHYR